MHYEKERAEISKFVKMLKKQKRILAEQLELARTEYPILVLAYEIQQVTIEELLSARSLETVRMGDLVEALFGDTVVDRSAVIETERRYEELINCIGRSTDYTSGLDCFDKFHGND